MLARNRARCAWLRVALLLPSPSLRSAAWARPGRDGKAGSTLAKTVEDTASTASPPAIASACRGSAGPAGCASGAAAGRRTYALDRHASLAMTSPISNNNPNHHPTSSTPKDTAPSAAQYHANGSSAHSSCRRNHRISTHVLTNAVTPATTAASTASSNVPAGTASRSSFGTSSTVAPRITGVAIMNEKCAAPAWSSPRSRPPTIVTPDREIPGISARHCQQPIASASGLLSLDSARGRSAGARPRSRSAPNRIAPLTIRNPAATTGEANSPRKNFSKKCGHYRVLFVRSWSVSVGHSIVSQVQPRRDHGARLDAGVYAWRPYRPARCLLTRNRTARGQLLAAPP